MWGTVIIVLIIIALAIAAIFITGSNIFKLRTYYEAGKILTKRSDKDREMVTEEDLDRLPEPVRNYLKYTQIIGKQKIRTCRLKQKGRIRTHPDQGWMPFTADEYFSVDPPAFLWQAKVRYGPFTLLRARDKYTNGKGNMLIMLLSLLPLVNERGKELDQGALLRYLGEMVWFPSAFLSDYIEWDAMDSRSARATITVKDVSATGVFHFDDEEKIAEFTALRYRSVNGKYSQDKWSTPVSEYKEINGLLVPTRGEAIWKLESGDFSYFKGNLARIDYNWHQPY